MPVIDPLDIIVEYILIAFLIAVVLSPLAWMKSSPGLVRVTAFRRQAMALGLHVQLVPEVDADDTVTRRDAVRYVLPFPPDQAAELRERWGNWTLMRGSRRGWSSPWSEWRWFRAEAPASCHGKITKTISQLPENVYALRADGSGLAVFLRETGDVAVVQQSADSLRQLLAP